MDNEDAIIGTIWTRRQTLKLGLGAMLGTLAGCVSSKLQTASMPATTTQPAIAARPLVVSPALTEGPFFVDEKLNRSNLLAGTTRASVIDATPLALSLNVLCLDGAGRPQALSGAIVDVWHCDAIGVYSDENQPMNHERTGGQQWLRGYQAIDSSGIARFDTIVPGWYEGRTPHIHFKVRQFDAANKKTAEFTSQLFFNDSIAQTIYNKKPYRIADDNFQGNAGDGIYGERLSDGSVAGDHQMLLLTPTDAGYQAAFTIVVNDKALHTPYNDRMRGGPPGGFPGGPGGPPPGFGPPPFGGPDDFGPPM